MTLFQQKVYDAVKKIPKGKVFTYKEIAQIIGSPDAARAVGAALKKNTDPGVPCHRVIKSNGEPGGYNGLAGKKIQLLRSEGAI